MRPSVLCSVLVVAIGGFVAPDVAQAAPKAPTCGDNKLNQPSEECDGRADGACPDQCLADCTCPPPEIGFESGYSNLARTGPATIDTSDPEILFEVFAQFSTVDLNVSNIDARAVAGTTEIPLTATERVMVTTPKGVFWTFSIDGTPLCNPPGSFWVVIVSVMSNDGTRDLATSSKLVVCQS